jgi:hypothetical protein
VSGRPYDYKIDYSIIDALSKKGKLGYRELKEEIGCKSFDVFDNHKKKLVENNYITCSKDNSYRQGQKLPYCLTERIKSEIKLGICRVNHDTKYKDALQDSIEEKRMQIYYLILCGMALNIHSYNSFNNNQYHLQIKKNPGEELRDIISRKYTNNQKAEESQENDIKTTNKNNRSDLGFACDYNSIKDEDYEQYASLSIKDLIESTFGILGYWHIQLNEKIVKDALSLLKEEEIVKEIRLNDESRYVISDSIIKYFIMDCIHLFYGIVEFRYDLIWSHIRSPRGYEIKYFKIFFKKEMYERILNYQRQLKENKASLRIMRKGKPRQYADNKNDRQETIDLLSVRLYEFYNQLKIKHSKVFKEYESIAIIILDTFFPTFLIDEIKNIENKYKNKFYQKIFLNTPWGTIHGEL